MAQYIRSKHFSTFSIQAPHRTPPFSIKPPTPLILPHLFKPSSSRPFGTLLLLFRTPSSATGPSIATYTSLPNPLPCVCQNLCILLTPLEPRAIWTVTSHKQSAPPNTLLPTSCLCRRLLTYAHQSLPLRHTLSAMSPPLPPHDPRKLSLIRRCATEHCRPRERDNGASIKPQSKRNVGSAWMQTANEGKEADSRRAKKPRIEGGMQLERLPRGRRRILNRGAPLERLPTTEVTRTCPHRGMIMASLRRHPFLSARPQWGGSVILGRTTILMVILPNMPLRQFKVF